VLAVGIWLLVDDDILKLVDFIVPDESALFHAAAILLIALGAFVVLVSVLGFVGACIEHRTVLAVVSPPPTRLTAIGFVNGRWQFSTPHRINTP